MGKFSVGDGRYTIIAKDRQEASQIFLDEMERVDIIKEKMSALLTNNGIASQNFIENSSEENLHIEFDDATSLIFNDPDNSTTKGEVVQRSSENGHNTYNLAYRYPNVQGHNADFRLAHEMGHLILNPSNSNRQVYDAQTNSRQVSGLIRTQDNGQSFYGQQMQENAINLLAELGIRGEHSADDILTGKADVSEFNLYKKADDLVKLLAVSMRNDFDKEMSFEQLTQNKIDSVIEHSDGTKEPANTFFYGLVNDSSIIENEFDKYMGKGAWRELDTAITRLHQNNMSQEQFNAIFQSAQGLISEFANTRMQDKYRETVNRDGINVPNIENKQRMLNQMMGIKERQTQQISNQPQEIDMPEGYKINEFGKIIRPDREEKQAEEPIQEQTIDIVKLSFKQKIAQFLQRNSSLMKLPFLEKFVNNQLNVLPPARQERTTQSTQNTRESFLSSIRNFDNYGKMPEPHGMSDPGKIAQMKRKMEQNQQSNDNERG